MASRTNLGSRLADDEEYIIRGIIIRGVRHHPRFDPSLNVVDFSSSLKENESKLNFLRIIRIDNGDFTIDEEGVAILKRLPLLRTLFAEWSASSLSKLLANLNFETVIFGYDVTHEDILLAMRMPKLRKLSCVIRGHLPGLDTLRSLRILQLHMHDTVVVSPAQIVQTIKEALQNPNLRVFTFELGKKSSESLRDLLQLVLQHEKLRYVEVSGYSGAPLDHEFLEPFELKNMVLKIRSRHATRRSAEFERLVARRMAGGLPLMQLQLGMNLGLPMKDGDHAIMHRVREFLNVGEAATVDPPQPDIYALLD